MLYHDIACVMERFKLKSSGLDFLGTVWDNGFIGFPGVVLGWRSGGDYSFIGFRGLVLGCFGLVFLERVVGDLF